MEASPKKENSLFSILQDGKVQLGLLVLLLFLYIMTKHVLIGFLTLLCMVFLLGVELYAGIKKHGIKTEVFETSYSIALALLVWLVFTFALNNNSPVSAVVSCSMVDDILRGDLIIVKGEENYNAQQLQVTTEEIQELMQDPIVLYKDAKMSVKGSMYSFCQSAYANKEYCAEFAKNPKDFIEKRGSFSFKYALCQRKSLEGNYATQEPCLSEISYKGQDFSLSKEGEVLVYTPTEKDLFYIMLGGSDVIHRAVLKLVDSDDKIYYITKGDNNNIADLQFYSYLNDRGNYVVSSKQVKGKKIFKLPFLGYYKLFLIGSFHEDDYCKTKLL